MNLPLCFYHEDYRHSQAKLECFLKQFDRRVSQSRRPAPICRSARRTPNPLVTYRPPGIAHLYDVSED